jgi:hypothetical protein
MTSTMKLKIAIINQYNAKKAFVKEFKSDVHFNKWYMNQLELGNKIIHISS